MSERRHLDKGGSEAALVRHGKATGKPRDVIGRRWGDTVDVMVMTNSGVVVARARGDGVDSRQLGGAGVVAAQT
jgi:hypothetical protein